MLVDVNVIVVLTFDLFVCDQQSARTSPGSVCSLRGGAAVPGSPAVTIVVCIRVYTYMFCQVLVT